MWGIHVISSFYSIRAKIDNRFHESFQRTTYEPLKVHSSRNCGKELNGTFAFGKHATFLDLYCRKLAVKLEIVGE